MLSPTSSACTVQTPGSSHWICETVKWQMLIHHLLHKFLMVKLANQHSSVQCNVFHPKRSTEGVLKMNKCCGQVLVLSGHQGADVLQWLVASSPLSHSIWDGSQHNTSEALPAGVSWHPTKVPPQSQLVHSVAGYNGVELKNHYRAPVSGQSTSGVHKFYQPLSSMTFSQQMWDSQMYFLNYATEKVPLGHLLHAWLWRVTAPSFWFRGTNNSSVFFLLLLMVLLVVMSKPPLLTVPWVHQWSTLFIMMEASVMGWGFQSSNGNQDQGLWISAQQRVRINIQELLVPPLFLQRAPSMHGICLLLHEKSDGSSLHGSPKYHLTRVTAGNFRVPFF